MQLNFSFGDDSNICFDVHTKIFQLHIAILIPRGMSGVVFYKSTAEIFFLNGHVELFQLRITIFDTRGMFDAVFYDSTAQFCFG